MASLGRLVIELAANTARLQSDMGKAIGIAESAAHKIETAFKFAGGGLLGEALLETVKKSIEFGDSINRAAIKAGIGTKAMSELTYAAKLAHVDIDALSTGIKKMEVALSKAGTGAKEPLLALSALGLTLEQLQKRKPEAQFELLADRISKLTDPADRARAATDLFGKAGADLLPLFEQGAAGIAKARAEAEKLGISFGEDQIKALTAADESVKRLSSSWSAFAAKLVADIAPALADIGDKLAGIDTRGIEQQISDIDKLIAKAGSTGFGPGVDSQKAIQGLLAQRSALVGRKDLEVMQGLQTGTFGGPQSRTANASAIGYQAADAAAKAAEEQQKHVDQFGKGIDDIDAMISKSADDELKAANDSWSDQMIAWQAFEDDRAKTEAETNHQIEMWREEQAKKLSDGAQIFKDAWMNAIDDMISRGKLDFGEFFKYIVAEFAKRGIAKLFDQMFAGKSSSGGGGGLGSVIGDIFGGLFGGGGGTTGADDFVNTFGPGKASGGAVSAGTLYPVGERGMEMFRPAVNGSIIPNNALGGSNVVNIHNHIDARGATQDLVKVLPSILDQTSRATEARIVERLRRKHYGSLQTA